MSDLTQNIELLFTATNRTGSVISGIGGDLNDLTGNVRQVAQPFSDITEAVVKLDTVLAALAAGGMIASVNAAGQFRGSVSEIGSLVSDTAFDVNAFGNSIKEYARDSTFGIKDINSALYSAVSAGIDYKDAIGAVNEAEKLATAGKAGLNESTVLLVGTLNAYGEGMDVAERFSDIFFQTVKRGQTTLPELASSMSQVSNIAAAADVPLETVAATIATLTAKGQPTSEAITAIRGALTAMIKPTVEAQKTANALGIEFNASALKSRGFEGVLHDVYEATGGNVEQIGKLFGNVEGLTGVLAAFGNDGGKAFMDNLEAMRNAAGSTDEAYKKMAKEFEKVNQRIKNNVNTTLIEVGERLLTGYNELAGSLVNVFKGLSIGLDSGAFDPLFDALNKAAKEVSEVMDDVAQALPEALEGVDFTGLLDAFGDIRNAIGGLFDGLDLGDPEDLAELIQRIVDTGENLTRFSQGIGEVFIEVGGYVVDLIEWFNSLDSETKELYGVMAGSGAAVMLLSGPIEAVAGAIKGLGGIIGTLSSSVVPKVASSLLGSGGLAGALTTVAPLFAAAFGGVAVGSLINEVVPGVRQTAQSIFELVDKYTGLIGVEKQHREVQQEGIAVQERFREVMSDRAKAAKEASDKDQEYFLSIVNGAENAGSWTEYLTDEMRKLGILIEEKKALNVDTEKAKGTINGFYRTIEEYRDGKKWIVKIPVDTSGVTEAAKKIEEEIPAAKRLEIETDLRVEEVKAQAKTTQAALQFRAEVDIAEIEAFSKTTVAIADGISEMFSSTGDTISSLFSSLGDAGSLSDKWDIKDAIRNEQEYRNRALKTEEKLVNAQIKLLNARADAVERGEALVTVDGAGLQPHLEFIMWEVFRAIQVRATQEGFNQLLLGG